MREKSLSKEEIITIISKDLYLRKDIIEEIISKYHDIIAEEIVNTGNFNISGILNVKSHDWGGYTNKLKTVEPHKRLSVKISQKLRLLFKNFGPGTPNHGNINRNNWDKAGKILISADRKPRTENKNLLETKEEQSFYNPLLDEDDDY